MGLLTTFSEINKKWPNQSFKILFDPLTKLELFELGYFASSDIPFRCFSIKLNPGDNHDKDVALLYSAASKQFISLLNKDDGLVLTLYENNKDEISQHLELIKTDLAKFKDQLTSMREDLRDQIVKCILVERKVDEAMHFTLSNEVNRRVYFAIGECRERAALIPIFQNSKGADLVQLALHKWMDYVLRLNQDEKFPEEKTTGLIKNFLQIKKWLKDLITKQLAGISTAKEEINV
ncbi:hypothetical protein DSAG12_00153 [Promethearchaeum syntrophicum]|uniref:Uncharacterized protein n=1 Tax=Promethearchaeum syntrophicum TaxID=2594042 RepID=A0A5B9D680_9ARCH|nr:hypothetical protein [Candidatus Prometheoarchaeum syntrophicum]QEE14340.1 hypothetical protein DSAG12_00153 [Candidatus Prometheoarchaeum syntrophicum]